MRLIIAEKPSVARELASVVVGGGKRRDGSEFYRKKLKAAEAARVGYIECGSGITVSWCLGHLLEQC